jgi:hypothetical protein
MAFNPGWVVRPANLLLLVRPRPSGALVGSQSETRSQCSNRMLSFLPDCWRPVSVVRLWCIGLGPRLSSGIDRATGRPVSQA